MRASLASALCLVLLQLGCSQETKWSAVNRLIDTRFGDVPRITTDSLSERLGDRPARRTVLLDARTAEEYAVSHLPGAHRVDPDARAFPALDTLDRDAPVVVYCSVGYRSARVTRRLRDAGFRNASNLQGSIFRWANEGRPVVRGGQRVREVHPYDDTWGDLLDPDLRAHEAGDSPKSKIADPKLPESQVGDRSSRPDST